MIIAATRYGSVGGSSKLPAYTYTGIAPLLYKDDETGNWELVFKGTGTITFNKNVNVEVFAVGGGQPGGTGDGSYTSATSAWAEGGKGGNGGATVTGTAQLIKDTEYTVTVGESGSSTSAFGVTAASGTGSAGGNGARTPSRAAENGTSSTTYAFGDQNTLYAPGTLYGAGGAGAGANANGSNLGAGTGGATGGGDGGTDTTSGSTDKIGKPGTANTGAGGGGGATLAVNENAPTKYAGGAGGSGIVIIRNVRTST